jgi:hypothetical protein
MQPRIAALTAPLCVLVLAIAAPSASQEPPDSFEWFVGYSYLHSPGGSVLAATASDDNFPLGWTAGGARRVWRSMSIVGEATGHYKSRTTLVEDVTLSYHAFLGGPRVSARLGRLTEFGQVLTGVTHGHASAFGTTVAATDLSLQPGGGLDYAINPSVAARLQFDYRWIRPSDGRDSTNQFRAVAAVVLH